MLSVVTTLVAGTMSSIPAAYHFGRMAPYSLVANTLALPVVGVLVMPFALLSAVLMPLELEAAPLWVMGEVCLGRHGDLRLGRRISGREAVLAQPAPWKTVIVVAGAVVLCMVQGRLRLAGLPGHRPASR